MSTTLASGELKALCEEYFAEHGINSIKIQKFYSNSRPENTYRIDFKYDGRPKIFIFRGALYSRGMGKSNIKAAYEILTNENDQGNLIPIKSAESFKETLKFYFPGNDTRLEDQTKQIAVLESQIKTMHECLLDITQAFKSILKNF